MLPKQVGEKLPLMLCLRMNPLEEHSMLKKFMTESIRFILNTVVIFQYILGKTIKVLLTSTTFLIDYLFSCLGNIYATFPWKASCVCISAWNGGKRISIFFTNRQRRKRASETSDRYFQGRP